MNSERTISGEGIRIDFMRVAPESEEEIIKQIRERFGDSEVAVFRALGHYDLIFIYSNFDQRDVFFLGSIEGIRSFSYLDCFYFSDDDSAKIIKKLLESKILASTICAMRRSFLVDTGGVDNDEIKSKLEENIFYLLSLAWGEQVFLYAGDEMNTLWNNSRDFIQWLHPKALDIHSIFGINYSLFQESESKDSGNWDWVETIDPSFHLEWQVELKCSENAHSLNLFNKIVDNVVKNSQHKFELENRSNLISHSILKSKINGGDWMSVFESIREIRMQGTNLINSTKLLIYQNSKT